MTPHDRDRDDSALEEALRQALASRAESVRAEPDPFGLAQRIADSGGRSARRARLMLVASVIALGGTLGGILAAVMTPDRPQSAFLSSSGGDQGGRLPTGPSSRDGGPGGAGPAHAALAPAVRPSPDIARNTAAGVALEASATWMAPVDLTAGPASSGCYAYELVTTSATERTATGTVAGGASGVVGIDPLQATGLEVVDSGDVLASGGKALWWATVAVGGRVARVAAEEPSGGTDAMRPEAGIAVLGGIVPDADASRYFSVVAETPSGEALASIGFQLGWGSERGGGASSGSLRASSGCAEVSGSADSRATAGSVPASPLLAASSVVAAFDQAYGAGGPGGLSERLGAVRGLRVPGEQAAGAGRSAVLVKAVRFLSARTAEVIYRVGSRPWETGTASRVEAGRWEVTKATFCGDATAGVLAQRVVSGLGSACSKSTGATP